MEHFDRLERRTRETYRLGAWVRPRVIEFALKQTESVSLKANRVFDEVDVLLTPAIAHRPPKVGILDNAGSIESMVRSMPAIAYAAIWNVAGNPAAAVPCGIADDGLPVGVQLVGRLHEETTLLSLSRSSRPPGPGRCLPGNLAPVTARAIEVVDLTMTYGDLRAVDGVSLEVGEGEFVGILGPNGAGKTTTLETIEGLRQPDSGSVTVLGMPVWPRNAALLPRIGVQLQASAFFERLTAREQIHTFASLYGVSAKTADEWLETVGLTDKVRHPSRGLVGWAGAAALDRLCAGARPRSALPRRANRFPGPAGQAQPVGPALRPQRLRAHRRADHALHGRGRDPL